MSNDHHGATVPSQPPAGPAAPTATPRIASPDDVRERLAYLFRASLQEGRLHPLFHLIQQYRLEEHA
jgi:hypothetical protein